MRADATNTDTHAATAHMASVNRKKSDSVATGVAFQEGQ